jgi:hypothetical protein
MTVVRVIVAQKNADGGPHQDWTPEEKSWRGPSKIRGGGGPDPPTPPVVAPLICNVI